MATLAGKKTPPRPFLPSRTASFPSFDGKSTGPIRKKWTLKWLFPRRHKKLKHEQKTKEVFHKGKLLECIGKINEIHKIN